MMEKGKFKSKLKEVLGGIIVVIAIFIGRGYYRQYTCFKTAEEVFATLQTKALSEVEGVDNIVEVNESKIEELNKKYPTGSLGAKVYFWMEWCMEGVCEYSGTGRIVYRNKQTGEKVVCRANLSVSVTKADKDNLNVEVAQELDDSSICDFVNFFSDEQSEENFNQEGQQESSDVINEQDDVNDESYIVTDLKEYQALHELKRKQLTAVGYREFCKSEEGRRVEISMYVADVSVMPVLGDLLITAVQNGSDVDRGNYDVWCNVVDGTDGRKLGTLIKRLRKGEAIKVTGVFSENQGREILAQKIDIVK